MLPQGALKPNEEDMLTVLLLAPSGPYHQTDDQLL